MLRKFTILLNLFFILILLNNNVLSQNVNSISELSISTDIMSRYIWRGLQLGGAYPSLQPGIKYKNHNITIGSWGAFSTSGLQSQETDIYISYDIKKLFTFTVTDYFFPNETSNYDYFNYDKDETGHVFETLLKFNGTDKLPLTVILATNFYGADAKNTNGDNVFSTYAEIGFSSKIKETNLDIFVGAAINSPGNEIRGFYGNTKTGVINLGLTAKKNISITDKFALPVSSSLIFNPYAKRIYMIFGISF